MSAAAEQDFAVHDDRGRTSQAELVANDPKRRTEVNKLSKAAKERLLHYWPFLARANQLFCDAVIWTVWLILAGRGFGKSRTGAEAVRHAIFKCGCRRVALVARTATDARDVMVTGQSGLLNIGPVEERPIYERSKRRLVFPNGAIATLYSADNPDQLRGPEHDFAWADELAAWRYLEEAWDNLIMGLRIAGGLCRVVVTTTPRRLEFLRKLAKADGTFLTKGSTFDNLKNLHPNVRRNLLKYRGTSKERQELYGEILGDVDGALWSTTLLDRNRITRADEAPKNFRRIVVGVDPATTDTKDSDETGIVVAGLGFDGRTYILADHTGRYGPEKWAEKIVEVASFWKAAEIVAETNAGGDLVELAVRNVYKLKKRPQVPRITVIRSTEDKSSRAEPVVILYEMGLVSHVGRFSHVEDEMTTWVPPNKAEGSRKKQKSPGGIDALVFAVNSLNPNSGGIAAIAPANRAPDYSSILPRSMK